MGTNYYVKEPKCECCGHKKKELHIGKKSAGWSFLFHATEELTSWESWYFFLIDKQIVDEYGRAVSLEDFSAMVRSTANDRNHTAYCLDHHSEHVASYCFLDPEGYSFSKCNFS